MIAIKVGDSVMVVKPLGCCPSITLGHVFTVTAISFKELPKCTVCGTIHQQCAIAYRDNGGGYPLWRLRKLPPLSEPETAETTSEATA